MVVVVTVFLLCTALSAAQQVPLTSSPLCSTTMYRMGFGVEMTNYLNMNLTIPEFIGENFTDSFQYFTVNGASRLDLWSDGGLKQVFSTNENIYLYDAETGSCSAVSDDLPGDIKSSQRLSGALSELIVSLTGSALARPVLYRGVAMETVRLYNVSAWLSLLLPPTSQVGAVKYTVDAYYTLPYQGKINYAATTNCATLRYINLWIENITFAQYVNISFDWIGTDVVGDNLVAIPAVCTTQGATQATPTPSSSPFVTLPMPTIPTQYTARIITTMVERGETVTMVASYSAADRLAKVSVTSPVTDLVGRGLTYTWTVVGSDQTAYYRTSSTVPQGAMSMIDNGLRQYFWPDVDTCVRNVFFLDLVSGSLGQLLEISGTPVYMGTAVVRNVLCNVWQSYNGTLMIQWYWANTTMFRRSINTPLMRIEIRGVGTSPLFVHHPFFQQGSLVPDAIASDACSTLYPFDPHCNGDVSSGSMFYHVHDFTSFVAKMSSVDKALDPVCASPAMVESYGSVICSGSTSVSAGTAVALVLAAVVLFVGGMCCQWCRMTPQIREVEEELFEAVKAMKQFEQQHLRQTTQGQEQAGPSDGGGALPSTEANTSGQASSSSATKPPSRVY